jgi:hypothetical protein
MDLGHPLHPYEPIEHEVRIETHAIRRYCHPVSFSRADAEDVAKMLGVSRGFLWWARRRGDFEENLIPHLGGKRGRPVPLLSLRVDLLDPSARGYARPHAVWGDKWEFLARKVPEGFEQTVVRRPVFRSRSRRYGGKGVWGCGGDREDPHLNSGAEYQEQEEGYREMRKDGNGDEMQHIGWMWVCPSCGKEVRVIYYPVTVMNLFDCGEFEDPGRGEFRTQNSEFRSADMEEEGRAAAGFFACGRCHDVCHFSSISKNAWNQVVSYFTAGMLYGSEVERPGLFVGERKRARVRVMNREAPKRRKVFTRLRNGWTYEQIARDLGMTRNAVRCHVMVICREEGVGDRRELARKLGFAEAEGRSQRSEVRGQKSEVREGMNVEHPTSNIEHRTSNIEQSNGSACVGGDQ